MAVSAPATAPNNPAAPAAAGPSKKRGRTAGAISWNPIEGLIAYKALCHADEKQSASSKDERYKNAKTYYDATIAKSRDWGVWESTQGVKSPEHSSLVRTGEMIYERGKKLRRWLRKVATGFEDEWHTVGTDGEESYDNMPSGFNDAVEWWTKCEDKVLQDMRATDKYLPVELKLTFRYVCPDSPYLSADAASGANDALPDAALEVLGRRGDKRFYIDPRKRLESSNKGATQMAQKVLARATASLGGDPRTPAGNLLMPPPPPQDTPVTHHDPEMQVAMLRVSVLMERIAGGLGFDVSNLPTAPAPA